MPDIRKEIVLLIADDDDGHALLVEKNLRRAALGNHIERFRDGQALLDFLFQRGEHQRECEKPYLLLLDIRMPKVDGLDVLREIKQHDVLRKIPVIMLTTTDDPREVERCHELGCSHYIVKPVDYSQFADAIKKLGQFITLVLVPEISEPKPPTP